MAFRCQNALPMIWILLPKKFAQRCEAAMTSTAFLLHEEKRVANATRFLLLGQVLLGAVGGHGAISHGGDNLAQSFGTDIPNSIDTGKAGLGRFTGHNIAGFIQFQNAIHKLGGRGSADTDEQSVAGEFLFFAT